MKPTLTIATSLPKSARDTKRAAKAVCITREVLNAIAATIGSQPPETGGMLFGPAQVEGVTDFVFDAVGSRRATTVAYAPDVVFCNAEQERQLDGRPMRLLDGMVHSHPGLAGAAFPSPERGPAQGDMGYARAALSMNEHMTRFLMPILTGARTGTPLLTPWVVEADDPRFPAFANVIVCQEDGFPAREFPEGLAEKTGEQRVVAPLVIALDLDHLVDRVGAPVALDGRVLCLSTGDLRYEVGLPEGFPLVPPVLTVHSAVGIQFLPIPWKRRTTECVELRLATVFERAKLCAVEV